MSCRAVSAFVSDGNASPRSEPGISFLRRVAAHEHQPRSQLRRPKAAKNGHPYRSHRRRLHCQRCSAGCLQQRAARNIAAIASRSYEAAQVASVFGVFPSEKYEELLADSSIAILDIAVPPDQQLTIIRATVRHNDHIQGILCQKPFPQTMRMPARSVRFAAKLELPWWSIRNMRFDQSIRALKTLLDRGYLGEPVLATIEMRAVPHWQTWLADYGRLTLLNMSIHHLDAFRYLFWRAGKGFCQCATGSKDAARAS